MVLFKNIDNVLQVLDDSLLQALNLFDKRHDGGCHPDARNWLVKKGSTHPKLVWQAMLELMKNQEIIKQITVRKINPLQLETVALLHDLGRLQEIDENAHFHLLQEQKTLTHGDVSAQILLGLGEVDAEVLLPIKYHDKYNFSKGLACDKSYLELPKTLQEKIKFIWKLLLDADRLGNMAYQAKFGVAGTSEMLDPKIISKAEISPFLYQSFMANKNFNAEYYHYRHTYADVLIVFMAMITQLHFQVSKQICKQRYFDKIYANLITEIENAEGTIQQKIQAKQQTENLYSVLRKM